MHILGEFIVSAFLQHPKKSAYAPQVREWFAQLRSLGISFDHKGCADLRVESPHTLPGRWIWQEPILKRTELQT